MMRIRVRRNIPAHDLPAGVTAGKDYVVIGIESNFYRLLDDDRDPCLYDPELFDITDPTEPPDWIDQFPHAPERYAYPPELAEVGFFEDYHDKIPSAVDRFWDYIERAYPSLGPRPNPLP